MSNAAPFLLFLGVAVVFWLFMIRPAQRRQRQHQSLQSSLGVGDEVMTTSGIFGEVCALDEEAVHLQIAEGVQIRVVRAAIGRVVTPAIQDPDEETTLADSSVEPEEKQ
jgi:preprotein translocase subunit YajC